MGEPEDYAAEGWGGRLQYKLQALVYDILAGKRCSECGYSTKVQAETGT